MSVSYMQVKNVIGQECLICEEDINNMSSLKIHLSRIELRCKLRKNCSQAVSPACDRALCRTSGKMILSNLPVTGQTGGW